jgi:hypothetical protein
MAEDVSPHDLVDDGSRLRVWWPLDDLRHRRLSGQCESTEGVHDQVNPEHLDGVERRVTQDASLHTYFLGVCFHANLQLD